MSAPKSIAHALAEARRLALSGEGIGIELAMSLAERADLDPLTALADEVRRARLGPGFALCSIINAKSGRCSEDCRFCAQSGRHATGAPVYARIDPDEALALARDNDGHGIRRLSLVASGRGPGPDLLDDLAVLYRELRQRTGPRLCASLGLLASGQAERLRAMGVERYHCNLEACAEFFPLICASHGHGDKVATLEAARAAGLSLCSGGILGMGESRADRVRLALELRGLGVRSIPLNVLSPIPGTPLASVAALEIDELLCAVALFRLVNPDAVIRMAGGRGRFGNEQYRVFSAGANGAIVGNYLTTLGNPIQADLRHIAALGFLLDREPGNGS